MSNPIYPCLWFENQAKAAAEFYCSVFDNARITELSDLVVRFELDGAKVMGLNGGPEYKINPSISLFVTCTSDEEIERTWNRLSEGGSVLMPLGQYPWSPKYGWVVDRFGMTWQLILGELPSGTQKIVPCLLFVGNQYGNALPALRSYASLFSNSQTLYQEMTKEGEAAETLLFGRFSLSGSQLIAMDGAGDHAFQFDEGVSLVVECDTQQEIDYFWEKLTEGGQEVQCGWLRDRFGIAWQVVPSDIGNLVSDPEKGPRVLHAIMKMIKIDLETLRNA